jgi:uncharacterized protein
MMDAIGASERFEVTMDQIIEMQKENYSGSVDLQYWELLTKEIKNKGFNDIIELLVPIYKKYLTESEIDAITAFYQSEVGQKMVSKFPLISKESMQAGAEWGEKLYEQVTQKIDSSNELKFNTMLEDCGLFHEGRFRYALPDGTIVNIVRNGNVQVESTPYGEIKSRIEWITNCRYNIWELLEDNVTSVPDPVEVNIFEITNNTYKFIAKKRGEDFYSIGELETIE